MAAARLQDPISSIWYASLYSSLPNKTRACARRAFGRQYHTSRRESGVNAPWSGTEAASLHFLRRFHGGGKGVNALCCSTFGLQVLCRKGRQRRNYVCSDLDGDQCGVNALFQRHVAENGVIGLAVRGGVG